MAHEQLLLPFPDPDAIDVCESLPQLLSPDEIYEQPDRFLPVLSEDRRIERKPAGIHVESLGEYFSMWANTSPEGGIIVIGIEDKGRVSGCRSLTIDNLNKLEKSGYLRCPMARYDTKRVPMKNHDGTDDFILLIRVFYHETRVVETCDGRVFIRKGDSRTELKKDEEKRQLRIDKGEVQHEQEPSGLAYPDDFNLDRVRQWASNVRTARGLNERLEDTKILEAFHLGKKKDGNFVANIACALIFAKDPVAIIPGCKIRFLRFDGTTEGSGEKFRAIKDDSIPGSIIDQISGISAILKSQIRTFSGLGKDNKFQTTPEYPQSAWIEAIVNACVHRSYHFKNMNIFVKMFDDRLLVDSPGPFPPAVTPETIYDVQHARNPFLIDALHYFGFTKAVGEGVRRMRDTMLEMDLPAPEFIQTEVGDAKVRVVLRNNIASRKAWIDSDIAAVLGAKLVSILSEKEKAVLNFVAVHNSINVSEAQRLTGHNWHTSKKLLTRLCEKGILHYEHRDDIAIDRQGKYVLSPKIGG